MASEVNSRGSQSSRRLGTRQFVSGTLKQVEIGLHCLYARIDANAQTGEVVCVLEGHSDFVKSVTVLPTIPPTLLSTSSDKSFQLWDLSPLEEKRRPVSRQVVKEHSRPIDSAAFRLSDDDSLTVWTADSLGALKQWAMPQVGVLFISALTADGFWAACVRQRLAFP